MKPVKILRRMAEELHGTHYNDMNPEEQRVTDLLIDAGFMQRNHDEVVTTTHSFEPNEEDE